MLLHNEFKTLGFLSEMVNLQSEIQEVHLKEHFFRIS